MDSVVMGYITKNLQGSDIENLMLANKRIHGTVSTSLHTQSRLAEHFQTTQSGLSSLDYRKFPEAVVDLGLGRAVGLPAGMVRHTGLSYRQVQEIYREAGARQLLLNPRTGKWLDFGE